MLDLLIVLAFVTHAVASGLRHRRSASRDLEQYFLAGREVEGWRAGLSMAATQFAADTPLLVTGLIATGGVFLLWRLWVYGLAFLLMAFVFATGWRRSGVLTDAELVDVRYSGRGVALLRGLKAIYYGTIINCAVMAMVLVAATRIAEAFLPWHAWLPAWLFEPLVGAVTALGVELHSGASGLPWAVVTADNALSLVLILVFTAAYSMTGGLRSVVSTDVAQLAVAMVGTLVYAWIVFDTVSEAGGLGAAVTDAYGRDVAAAHLSFVPSAGEALLPFGVVIGLQWVAQMNSDGTGYLAQRSMACTTDRQARIAGVLFTWVQILVRSLLWLVIGVGLLVLYPLESAGTSATAREMTFVRGIDELLPPGARGLMLTGLLAALASTLDTHLNWGASYWSNDLYKSLLCRRWLKRDPSERELVVVARLSGALLVAIALLVMAHVGSIQTAWTLSLLFGAGVGTVLVLRWLWERINLAAELAAIASSLVTAAVLLSVYGTDPQTEWLRLSLMAGVTTASVVLVTLLSAPTDEKVLTAFYQRVRPVGAWSRTAALAGDDPRAPWRGLGHRARDVLVCATSLFALLFGLGRLLVSPPDATPAWTWLAIAVGLALVPLWWRAVVAQPDSSP